MTSTYVLYTERTTLIFGLTRFGTARKIPVTSTLKANKQQQKKQQQQQQQYHKSKPSTCPAQNKLYDNTLRLKGSASTTIPKNSQHVNDSCLWNW